MSLQGKGIKIAVSGKGGTGKTTVAAGLAKYYARQGMRVYAVDADPDASLGTALGFPEELLEKLKPVVELKEVVRAKTGGGGSFIPLNPKVGDLLDAYSLRKENLLFFKMGGVKQGGTSCYCRENVVLNALVSSLLLEREEIVILDMSAGIEHLTRGTARGVDLVLVVTEPTKLSVQTAQRVKSLAFDLGIPKVAFIGNKVQKQEEEDFLKAHFPEGELLGFLPFAPLVLESSRRGEVSPSPCWQAVVEALAQQVLVLGRGETSPKALAEVKGGET